MMDWAQAATGEVLRGLSEPAIMNNWLEKNDEDAFVSIVAQVSTASTDEADRLDAALLSFAATNPDPDVRLRLVKFYAIFKIAEMIRHREFRGFPTTVASLRSG